MGNMSITSGVYTYNKEYAQTSYTYDVISSKYIDTYAYGTTNNDQSAYDRARLGDGTGEITIISSYVWYDDYAYFADTSYPWFRRGCYYNYETSAGIYCINIFDGNISVYDSARAALLAF